MFFPHFSSPNTLRWRRGRHVQVEAKSIKAFGVSALWKGWKLDMFLEAQQTVYQIILENSHFWEGEGTIPKSLGRIIVCDFCFGLSLGKILPSEPTVRFK